MEDLGAATPPGAKVRLSTVLYEELRRRIITGDYAQGRRLVEKQLAEELNASRVPVREALPRLANDGFIRLLPRRGAVVTTWTPELVDELFDARLALEVRAAQLAARRVNRDRSRLDVLRVLVDETRQATQGGDSLGFATHHSRLHQYLVDMSGNSLLSDLMRSISGRLMWMFHLIGEYDQSLACAEHELIADAIAAGDDELTASRVHAHIEAGRAPGVRRIQDIDHRRARGEYQSVDFSGGATSG